MNNLIDVIADIYKTVLINILFQYKAIYESYTFPSEDFDFQQYLDIMGSENESESDLKNTFLSTLRKNPGDHFVYTTALGLIFFDCDDIKNIAEMLDFFDRRNDAIDAIKDTESSAYKYLEPGADIQSLWQAEKEKREEEAKKREEEERKRKEAEEKERLQREEEEKRKKEAEEKTRREAEEKAEQERLAREEEERKKEEERAKVLKYGNTFKERFLNCIKGTPSEQYLIHNENEKDLLHANIPGIVFSYAGIIVADQYICWQGLYRPIDDIDRILWKGLTNGRNKTGNIITIETKGKYGRYGADAYEQSKSLINAINIGLGVLDVHYEEDCADEERREQLFSARSKTFAFYQDHKNDIDFNFLVNFRKRFKAYLLLDYRYGMVGHCKYFPFESLFDGEKRWNEILNDTTGHNQFVLFSSDDCIITEFYFIAQEGKLKIPCNTIYEFVSVADINVGEYRGIVVTSNGNYELDFNFKEEFYYKFNKIFEKFQPRNYVPHTGKNEGFCPRCKTFQKPIGFFSSKCPVCRSKIYMNDNEALKSLDYFDEKYPLALQEIEKNKYSADEKQLLELRSDKA